MTKQQKRAITYARVSSRKQSAEDRVSLADQERTCLAYCQAHKYTVVGSEQEVHSATTPDRPKLNAIVAQAEAGAFDVLVVHVPDRLMRNLDEAFALVHHLTRLSVSVEYVDNPPTNNPQSDKIVVTMRAWMAENETADRLRRTMPGRRASARGGHFPGSIRYGYVKDEKGRPVVDPATAPTVLRIFTEYTSGTPLNEVIRGLNRDHVATPHRGRRGDGRSGRWVRSTVRGVLTFPGYAGGPTTVVMGGETFEFQMPAIVPAALVRAAQATRQRNTVSKVHNVRYPFLVAGLVRCAPCNRVMGARSRLRQEKGRADRLDAAYRCTCRVDDPDGVAKGCVGRVSARDVDRAVWDELKSEFLPGPDGEQPSRALLRRRRGVADRAKVEAEAEAAARALAAYPRERTRWLDLFNDHTVDKTELQQRLRKLDADRANDQARLDALNARLTQLEPAGGWPYENIADQALTKWPDPTVAEGLAERRYLVQRFVEAVLVTRKAGATVVKVAWRPTH